MLVPRDTVLVTKASGWENPDSAARRLDVTSIRLTSRHRLTGKRIPADYQVEWFEGDVDIAALNRRWISPPLPVNFRLKNLNRNDYIHFALIEQASGTPGRIDPNETIAIYDSLGGQSCSAGALPSARSQRRATRCGRDRATC